MIILHFIFVAFYLCIQVLLVCFSYVLLHHLYDVIWYVCYFCIDFWIILYQNNIWERIFVEYLKHVYWCYIHFYDLYKSLFHWSPATPETGTPNRMSSRSFVGGPKPPLYINPPFATVTTIISPYFTTWSPILHGTLSQVRHGYLQEAFQQLPSWSGPFSCTAPVPWPWRGPVPGQRGPCTEGVYQWDFLRMEDPGNHNF